MRERWLARCGAVVEISDLITIIEDRLKLAGAAEYTIEIIAWTL